MLFHIMHLPPSLPPLLSTSYLPSLSPSLPTSSFLPLTLPLILPPSLPPSLPTTDQSLYSRGPLRPFFKGLYRVYRRARSVIFYFHS